MRLYRKLGFLFLVLSAIITNFLIVKNFDKLPDKLASHFDFSGTADGWFAKSTFFLMYAGLQTAIPLLFWAIYQWAKRSNGRGINIPHKDYWFEGSRRDETMAVIKDIFFFVAGTTTLFLTGVLRFTISANLAYPPRLPMTAFLLSLFTYGFVLTAGLYRMYRFFQLK